MGTGECPGSLGRTETAIPACAHGKAGWGSGRMVAEWERGTRHQGAPLHRLPTWLCRREAGRGRCNTFAQLCTEYIFRVTLRQNLAMQL